MSISLCFLSFCLTSLSCLLVCLSQCQVSVHVLLPVLFWVHYLVCLMLSFASFFLFALIMLNCVPIYSLSSTSFNHPPVYILATLSLCSSSCPLSWCLQPVCVFPVSLVFVYGFSFSCLFTSNKAVILSFISVCWVLHSGSTPCLPAAKTSELQTDHWVHQRNDGN